MKNKGITLIALVITIIVLLILAGISISMLNGDNGILKRAGDAKDYTIVGQEKEQVELAYVSAAIKKLGNNVTDGELQIELDSSVGDGKTDVSTNDDDTLNVLFKDTNHNYNVDNGKVAKIDDSTLKDKMYAIQDMTHFNDRIFILTKSGELSYLNFDRSKEGLIEIDISKKVHLDSNVKEINDLYYLKKNGDLYSIDYDYDNSEYINEKVASNVEKIYTNDGMTYISKNHELYVRTWNSQTGKEEFVKEEDNVKEYLGYDSYSKYDGTTVLANHGNPITLDEEVIFYDRNKDYIITKNDDLYSIDSSTKELKKKAENVVIFNPYTKRYLNNNGELFSLPNQKIAENVIYWDEGAYYINKNNELFDTQETTKIASDVKSILYLSGLCYVSLENKLYEAEYNNDGEFVSFKDIGYVILDYGDKWFKTTDNKIYYNFQEVV